MARESFVLYGKFLEPIMNLSAESRGWLFTAILTYHNTGEEITLPIDAKMAFLFIKNQMDLDSAKYKETCEKRAESGRKGGVLSKRSICLKNKQMGAKASKISKCKHNENENENGNDNDDIDTNDNTEKRKKLKKEKVLSLVPHIGNWNPYNEDVLIDKNWVLDFTDPVFEPYAKVPDSIKKDVEKWVRREKCGTIISKRFIAEQFTNFARRQGKISELLRTT
jgi:hypothetical protein